MDKILESITKLITLTQEKKIKWGASSAENERITKDENSYPIGAVFTTEYKAKYLRMYQQRVKVDKPSYSDYTTSALSIHHSCSDNNSYPYWYTKYVLEVTTINGDSIWTFPETPSLNDLFSAIQYQVAGISNLINDILAN